MDIRTAIQYLRVQAAKFADEEAFLFKDGKYVDRFIGTPAGVYIPEFVALQGVDLFHNHGAPHPWQTSALSPQDIIMSVQDRLHSVHAVTPHHIYSFFPKLASRADVKQVKLVFESLEQRVPDLERAQGSDIEQLAYAIEFAKLPGAFDTWITDPLPEQVPQIDLQRVFVWLDN